MDKQEYEAKRAAIYAQLAELDQQYIDANTDIKPGALVMAAGQRCRLKKYKVVGGVIYPILVREKNKNAKVYVSANSKIVEI